MKTVLKCHFWKGHLRIGFPRNRYLCQILPTTRQGGVCNWIEINCTGPRLTNYQSTPTSNIKCQQRKLKWTRLLVLVWMNKKKITKNTLKKKPKTKQTKSAFVQLLRTWSMKRAHGAGTWSDGPADGQLKSSESIPISISYSDTDQAIGHGWLLGGVTNPMEITTKEMLTRTWTWLFLAGMGDLGGLTRG